jgi:primosomal protein N' (replication factor Y) (superfamily II helicase)
LQEPSESGSFPLPRAVEGGGPPSTGFEMRDDHLVEVALPVPVFSTFTYAVDGPPPPPGTRVLVPFRREEKIGWVTGPGQEEQVLPRVRSVLDILEDEPSAPPDILDLARWMSDYYVAPLGVVLRSTLPSALADSSRDFLTLLEFPASDATPREGRLLEALARAGGPRHVRSLRRELGMGSLWPEIRKLSARGLVRHEVLPPREPSVRSRKVVRLERWVPDLQAREDLFGHSRRQREAFELLERSGGSLELAQLLALGGFHRSVVKALQDKGLVGVEDEERLRDPFRDRAPGRPAGLTPTPSQSAVLASLKEALSQPCPLPVLLHGITGSGKTLVYIELLREVVEKRGRGAIVLVPEISLTPQTVARFRAEFGDQVAVLHSALSDGERFDAWRQLRRGDKLIAVGARSAIFAPVPRLGAIVVDEEHDGSYKQSESPRYQARDVAVVRATRAGALCVLGSATPSLESWQNARSGKFRLLSLPERVGGGVLPPVRVVDLKKVWRRGGGVEEMAGTGRGPGGPKEKALKQGGEGGAGVLSPELVEGVRERLRRGEQVILLLNRRGYSNFVQCRECGEVWRCTACSVSLTFHRTTGRLLCHYCRHEESTPALCHRCGSRDLSFRGLGTEQVERIVGETFPQARIARMDMDTTSGKWSHHEILGRVERGEVDILLGTQMIAKGLDFPRVTLVGVVNADIGIHLPDFRASERTFQLLSQVAGRTGRGPLGGEVVVQTSLPEHYAIQAALKHDYEAFARRELGERRDPSYPPHTRLANVVASSPWEEEAAREAERGAAWVRDLVRRRHRGVEVVGPAPAPIEKLHGRWRWHFLLRCASPSTLGAVLCEFQESFDPTGRDVRIVLDRDPVALL